MGNTFAATVCEENIGVMSLAPIPLLNIFSYILPYEL